MDQEGVMGAPLWTCTGIGAVEDAVLRWHTSF